MKPLYGPLHRPLDRRIIREIAPQRIERWLGEEKVRQLREAMRGWYGGPICLLDVPGSVWIHSDGTFSGIFKHGAFASAMDVLESFAKRAGRIGRVPQYATVGAGFASVSEALQRSSQGYRQSRNFTKSGSTGVAAVSSSLWRLGPHPVAGSAPANAPGGTAFSSSSTGALAFNNPASGTLHLVGADAGVGVANSSLLCYDLLFGANKTMASSSPETVTGVPTRYQSTTASNEDYIGDNFGFIQVGGVALAGTAHNWQNCTYIDQGGVGSTLPTVTGVASAIVDRFDMTLNSWFVPLASGDIGIGAWTNIECSASVATGVIWFMIGHPIGFMTMTVANLTYPFDWLTNRDPAPRIFDNACVAFIEPSRSVTTAATYNGRLVAVNAAP